MEIVKKTLVICLMMSLATSIYYYAAGLDYIPQLILGDFSFFDIFSAVNAILWLFGNFISICILIGLVQILIKKEFTIVPIFKVPIYSILMFKLSWFFMSLLITDDRVGFFKVPSEGAWLFWISHVYGTAICVLGIVYFTYERKHAAQKDVKEVSKMARFINLFLDKMFVTCLVISHISILKDFDHVLKDVRFFGENFIWLSVLYHFIYYLVLELAFGQTLGKLHNNSYVAYENNRVKSIVLRTFCRWLPFDALSFFTEEGWHDKFSKTTVVKTTEL